MKALKRLLVGLAVLIICPLPALSDDLTEDLSQEQPAYSNAAQAMHAANLAEASLPGRIEEALQDENSDVSKAEGVLEEAQKAYEDALAADPNDPELESLKQSYKDAETAYAEAISDLAGVEQEQIQEMRQNRMGWGQIAHELGIHPGVLGLGHGKKMGMLDPEDPDVNLDEPADPEDPDAEIAEATQRDTSSGWNKGHGLATSSSGSAKKGLGLSGVSANAKGNAYGNSGKTNKGSGSSASSSSNASAQSASGQTGRGADGGPANSSSNNGGGSGKDKSSKSNNGNNGNKGGNGKGNGNSK